MNDRKWKAKDGRMISISEMAPPHARSTLALCKRRREDLSAIYLGALCRRVAAFNPEREAEIDEDLARMEALMRECSRDIEALEQRLGVGR